MAQALLQSTLSDGVRLVPVNPKVKSGKMCKMSLRGVSRIGGSPKSVDPSCYDAPVSQKTDPAVDAAGLFENQIRRSITMTERYQSVNGAWPDNVPTPTPQEALTGAKRLYRLVMGRGRKGKWALTSGRRHTWPRRGVFYVNPDKRGHFTLHGWQALVHDLSHYCHRQINPGHKPHDGRGTHAFLERTMIEHVVNSGWLEGKLKRPQKPVPIVDLKAVRHQRVLDRMAAWSAKRKRAENALRKLNRQRAYYERQLSV